LALFASDKKILLNKVKKRDWRNADQMKEIFVKLNEQSLKIGDVAWMLSEPDRMVRHYATQLIVSRRMRNAAVTVLKHARDATGAARNNLVNIIPLLKDDDALEKLGTMIESRDSRDRELAVDVVLKYPTAGVHSFLVKMLDHDDREYRYRALHKLTSDHKEGEVLSKEVRQYVAKLVEDKDERIRIKCIAVLVDHPTNELADLLLERLATENYNVKTAIIKHIEKLMTHPKLGMVDRLLPLLSQDDDMLRSMALSLTVKYSNPSEIIKKILIMSNQLMGWMRERILRTIREHGEDLMPPIVELLSHPDQDVRGKALIFASDFDSPLLVPPAVKLLGEDDWWTRIIAMDLLGRLKDERAVNPLIKCLDDDEVRWSAVEALSRIGSKKALGPIAKLLGDKSPEVRLQVIQTLELYNDPRALQLLKKSMERDPNVEVRERALQAYRTISDKHQRSVDEAELRQSFAYGKTDRRIDKLLTECRKVGASDLHVSPTSKPLMRMAGELTRVGEEALSAEQTSSMINGMLLPAQREIFDEEHQLDFCYVIPGVGRYRANVYKQRLGYGGVFRVIPNELPTFLDTRLPEHLVDITNYHQGMIIVTGPAGSGKSTTLAALINLINERKRDHVLTLEDPIEFVHPYKNALVNQREIGKHSKSFASALRAALREDPDVIVVGELRDQETMTLAMTAAETGHLVITTMNTTSAVKTVDRLVDAFPPKEQPSVRMMLSESVVVVTSQTLLPRADKKGRVACHEVLMITGPIRNLIRDNKTALIPSGMTVGKEQGQQTVDMALQTLLDEKIISPETAYRRADTKETFESQVPGLMEEKKKREKMKQIEASGEDAEQEAKGA